MSKLKHAVWDSQEYRRLVAKEGRLKLLWFLGNATLLAIFAFCSSLLEKGSILQSVTLGISLLLLVMIGITMVLCINSKALPWRQKKLSQFTKQKIQKFHDQLLGTEVSFPKSLESRIAVKVLSYETRVVDGLEHYILTAYGTDVPNKVLVYMETTPHSDLVFKALKQLVAGDIISVFLSNEREGTNRVEYFTGFAKETVVFSEEHSALVLHGVTERIAG